MLSTSVTFLLGNFLIKVAAAIHPAEPPPTIKILSNAMNYISFDVFNYNTKGDIVKVTFIVFYSPDSSSGRGVPGSGITTPGGSGHSISSSDVKLAKSIVLGISLNVCL